MTVHDNEGLRPDKDKAVSVAKASRRRKADEKAVSTNSVRLDVHDFKRERIIEQAVILFYRQGYRPTTLDEIASALGMTKPFIYSYFRNKAEILSVVSRKGLEECLSVAQRAAALDRSPREQLEWLVQEFTRAVIAHEPNIAIFFREEKNIDEQTMQLINDMRREFDRKMSRILQKGVDSGEFEIPNLRATTLAIGGMISWIYTWHRPGTRFPTPELAETMSRLVLKMVEKRR